MVGIVKADIGIKDGCIVGIGKSGNPQLQSGVDPELLVGPGTEVIAGEHLIATAGAIDAHVHYISPQQAHDALSNGVTTLFGGGTGPTDGTNGTTCTPGAVEHPPHARGDRGHAGQHRASSARATARCPRR